MEAYAIPLAALIVSIGTLIFAALTMKSNVDSASQGHLREQLKSIEQRLEQCEEHRKNLINENAQLMRKILRLNGENGK